LTILAGRGGTGKVSPDPAVPGSHRRCGGVAGDGEAGVEPCLLQGGLDAGFDLVGDMAVDLDHASVHPVAQPSGLRDLRDAGGDEPGLVTVAELVEGQPGPDRVNPHGGMRVVEVAVEGPG
jgi:hypothetical protein